ncbi:tyrosine-type recombinase/integrase [Sulfitobacter sp. SK011]|uniref:tyrosine-type recombinase/integrase n=1 Tax=Sulfitobacter sp. SK011 TaxID=1389004 RepID=UPI000E0BA8D7|nr:tyrosine-type recombinase/integrase [Sulfitobacter sp. SK011]AXI42056.1 hypothetical protein C1J02_08990 [Sulfitobacter sp. SK011]
MQNITSTVVENATLPIGKDQDFIRDSVLRGFGLKIGKTSKTFVVEGRVGNKVRRKVIGDAVGDKAITVTIARKKAIVLLAKFADGIDPSKNKKLHAADQITLQEAFEYKLERSKLKPTTLAMYRDAIDRRLADWRDRPLSTITPNDWIDRFLEIEENPGLASALCTKRVLSAIWNHTRLNLTDSDGYPILRANPTENTTKRTQRPSMVPPKKRPIADLKAWLAVVATMQPSRFQKYSEIALRTGCRNGEITTLTWKQVNLSDGYFDLKDTKNGRDHRVYMSSQCKAAFEHLEEEFGSTPFVWGAATYDTKKPFYTASKRYGSQHSPHDQRSTFVNLAIEAGIQEDVCKALINHVQLRSATDHYKDIGEPMQREAVQVISDLIDAKLLASN